MAGQFREVGDAIAQLVLSVDEDGNPASGDGASASFYSRVMNADDLTQTFNYADAGTADERVTAIVSSSTSVGKTVTETLSYAGSSGNYRVSGKTRTVS